MILHKDVPHGTWDYPFQVHQTELDNGLYLYPHAHEEIELTCITKGQGIFCVNGQEYTVKEGDIVFVAPNSIHLAVKTDEEPAAFFSVVFMPECLSFSKDSRPYRKYMEPMLEHRIRLGVIFDGSEPWHEKMRNLLWEMSELYSIADRELMCQSKLLEFWNILISNGVEEENMSGGDASISKLKGSIDYIRENYSGHITISELARITNMSEGHFSRVFKEYIKMTPIEYLVHVRLYEAKKMLAKNDLSVGEISLRCGFNDFSYFGRKFKEETGYSPRDYRNAIMKRK